MKQETFKGFDSLAFTEFMQDSLSTANFFKNSQGEMIMMVKNFTKPYQEKRKYIENTIFFSNDGKTFFQLYEAGSMGNGKQKSITFHNPHTNVLANQGKNFLEGEKGRLYIDGEVCFLMVQPRKYRPSSEIAEILQQETANTPEYYSGFQLVSRPDFAKMVFHPLPKVRRVEYVLQGSEDDILYIDCLEYNWNYTDFRVFRGTPDSLQEIPVLLKESDPIRRLKDGGTTIIKLETGTLTVPTQIGDFENESEKRPFFITVSGDKQMLSIVDKASVSVTYENNIPKVTIPAEV